MSAAILFLAYAFFIHLPNRVAYSIISCAVLMAAQAAIQIFHLLYFGGGMAPLSSLQYRLWLLVVPVSFYFFGRWAILPTVPLRPAMLLHLLPIPLLHMIPLQLALPMLFLLGTGYSIWLGALVYSLRVQRKQFRFEFFFFTAMSVIAVVVLILGFSIPYIDDAYFYYSYSSAIGLAFALMITALIANPNLVGELSDAARARYGVSTLRDVDVEACVSKLDSLMAESRVYQNEELSLASLAELLGISSHQLSELVNSRLGMGFSRYIRERRVEAAKVLLVSAPSQSILSISIDTGFKSQSTFYAAFKEVTGQSPGDYRKAHVRDK